MAEIRVTGPAFDRSAEMLSADALKFLAELQQRFGARRDELLELRRQRRNEVSKTGRLDFSPQTANVRSAEWTVALAPEDLLVFRVVNSLVKCYSESCQELDAPRLN